MAQGNSYTESFEKTLSNGNKVSSTGHEQSYGPRDLTNKFAGEVDTRGRIRQSITKLDVSGIAGLPAAGTVGDKPSKKNAPIPAGSIITRVELTQGSSALTAGTVGVQAVDASGNLVAADVDGLLSAVTGTGTEGAVVGTKVATDSYVICDSVAGGSADLLVEYIVA